MTLKAVIFSKAGPLPQVVLETPDHRKTLSAASGTRNTWATTTHIPAPRRLRLGYIGRRLTGVPFTRSRCVCRAGARPQRSDGSTGQGETCQKHERVHEEGD